MVSLADTNVGTGKSEHKARTANQLVLMSPVANKHNVDQSSGRESTESFIFLLPVAKKISW